MAETNLNAAQISNLTNLTDLAFSVPTMQPEGVQDQDETTYINPKWTQYFGYYKKIPELKSSIDAIAKWTLGKGYKADPFTTIILEKINGYGQDTFDTILKNMIVTSIINGDSFGEII